MGSEGKPSLPMRKGGYKIIPIALEENPPDYYPKFGLQDYSIDFQEKEKRHEDRNADHFRKRKCASLKKRKNGQWSFL